MLVRAEGHDAFAEAPFGAALVGRTWVHFAADAGLWGVVLFGAPDEADAAALVRSLALELEHPPHASIVDASRLERADGAAFSALARYVKEQRDALAKRVTRLALVRPSGVVEGAVVAGFYPVSGAPYPVEQFEAPGPALAWVGAAGSVGLALAELVEAAKGEPALLGALRAFVRRRLDADEDDASRALGVSTRTLQRRLREHGTTFQTELGRARIAEAQRRLRETDAPITNIALDVGYATLQQFSAAFHKATGSAPSAWRAVTRKSPY